MLFSVWWVSFQTLSCICMCMLRVLLFSLKHKSEYTSYSANFPPSKSAFSIFTDLQIANDTVDSCFQISVYFSSTKVGQTQHHMLDKGWLSIAYSHMTIQSIGSLFISLYLLRVHLNFILK